MLSKIKNNRFLMSLLLSCFSFIVAFMYNFTPLMQMQPDAIKFVWRSISSDVLVLLVSSSIVVSIISFICFFFGGMLNKKLNLNTKKGLSIQSLFCLCNNHEQLVSSKTIYYTFYLGV